MAAARALWPRGTERPHSAHISSLVTYSGRSPRAVCMFHHLQVYLRQDPDPRFRFFKSSSTLSPRKSSLATNETTTTTPSHSAPLIPDPQPDADNSSPMAHHSWRSFASTHLAPIKDYIAHRSDHQSQFHHFFRYPNPTSEVGCDDSDAKKQTGWTPFSSRRFTTRSYSEPDGVTGMERIVLLPGWASRRYRAGSELSNRTGTSRRHFLYKGVDAHPFAGAPYDIEVFVSGYVVKDSVLSRPQRTLLKLAKS